MHEEGLDDHKLFNTGRRKPWLNILKKNKEIKTKSRWYGLTPFSYTIDLVIFEEAEVTSSFHFHLRVLIYFHAFLRP